MSTRERLAWLLVVALTATATTLWWRGRARYEFRAGSNGAIVWKLDRQTGEAWVAHSGDRVWKPVTEPQVDEFGGLLVPEPADPFSDLIPTNKADAPKPNPSAK
jgi:hypothetical protein